MADREAEAYLRLLAEIMGVEAGDDLNAARQGIEKALGVDKPGPGSQLADAMGVSSHGAHPAGRGSSVEELLQRYTSGELQDSYPLPPAGTSPVVQWFSAEDKESYGAEDGFHPSADSYEFTKLWYQIMGELLDLRDCGDWHVAHGGLRWEYYGGATCGDLHSTVEAALSDSYDLYSEVSEAIQVLPTTDATVAEWSASDWESLLED